MVAWQLPVTNTLILCGTIINFLDQHSGALTAASTVLLTVFTAIYVVVTYSLVREQRRQRDLPSVAFELGAATSKGLELNVRNLGKGRAADVALNAGPRSVLLPGVTIDSLGPGFNLAPLETKTWTIQWAGQPPSGDVPLTLSYTDRERQTAWFSCFLVRFQGYTAHISSSLDEDVTARRLKAIAHKPLSLRRRIKFVWDNRGLQLEPALVDPLIRSAWSAHLKQGLEKALKLEGDFEASRGQI